MRIKSIGGGEITIADLSPDEQEKIGGAIRAGMWWVKGGEGKLVTSPCFEEAPNPIEDEEMLPFWRKVNPTEKANNNLELFNLEEEDDFFSPSIAIHSLCGHYYTPESYRTQADLLCGYGFECMRSRRGDDGRYWEIWYLSSLWAAKGALKKSIGNASESDNKKLKSALDFLSHNVIFGSLDVTVQRLAMPNPD